MSELEEEVARKKKQNCDYTSKKPLVYSICMKSASEMVSHKLY